MKKTERGSSLMGLLVAIVIIGVLAAVYLTGGVGIFGGSTDLPARADGQGKTTIGRAAARAKDEVCRSNLRQVNISIEVQKTADQIPSTLSELGLGEAFLKCSIPPNEAYRYDGQGGRVTCPHPGHESF
ncbi:MAG: hypothetical protein ABIV13_03615 [Fimbriimonadales bacterium]